MVYINKLNKDIFNRCSNRYCLVTDEHPHDVEFCTSQCTECARTSRRNVTGNLLYVSNHVTNIRQVRHDNITKVAKWCGGKVTAKETPWSGEAVWVDEDVSNPERYILIGVPVGPSKVIHERCARMGDFVAEVSLPGSGGCVYIPLSGPVVDVLFSVSGGWYGAKA